MSDVKPSKRAARVKNASHVASPGAEPSMFQDPAVRRMAYGALGLVILFLATVLGALATGVFSTSNGARTAGERQLMIAAEAVSRPGASGQAWASYVDALVVTGDLRQAQAALARGRASVPATAVASPDLDLSEARLFRAKKDYVEAVKAADNAMKGYKALLAVRAAASKDSTDGVVPVLGDNYYNAVLVKARSYADLRQWKDAVATFDIYIAKLPSSADILVDRGNAKAGMGDKAGAEKDFREALRYVPYDEEAKAGLKRIGVSQ